MNILRVNKILCLSQLMVGYHGNPVGCIKGQRVFFGDKYQCTRFLSDKILVNIDHVELKFENNFSRMYLLFFTYFLSFSITLVFYHFRVFYHLTIKLTIVSLLL